MVVHLGTKEHFNLFLEYLQRLPVDYLFKFFYFYKVHVQIKVSSELSQRIDFMLSLLKSPTSGSTQHIFGVEIKSNFISNFFLKIYIFLQKLIHFFFTN